jgi:hypothetical protein
MPNKELRLNNSWWNWLLADNNSAPNYNRDVFMTEELSEEKTRPLGHVVNLKQTLTKIDRLAAQTLVKGDTASSFVGDVSSQNLRGLSREAKSILNIRDDQKKSINVQVNYVEEGIYVESSEHGGKLEYFIPDNCAYCEFSFQKKEGAKVVSGSTLYDKTPHDLQKIVFAMEAASGIY